MGREYLTITNLLTRIFTSSVAKQIASSALDVGKSVAKEEAKKASFRCWEKCCGRRGGKVSFESVKPKIEENFTKIFGTYSTIYNTRH